MFPVALATCLPVSAAIAHEHGNGWQLVQGVDSCTVTMGFGGPGATRLILVKSISGNVSVLADNTKWLASDGANYTVRYDLDGTSYGGADAIGSTDGSRKGYFSQFDAAFAADFAKAGTVRISVGDQPLEDLSLTGTAAAMTAMDECLAAIRTRLAREARDNVGTLDLPPVPTANGAIAAGPAKPPTPIGFIVNWAPTTAFSSHARGRKGAAATGYVLTVGRDGMATCCEVSVSSGDPDLDAATCDIVRRDARFDPATDGAGRPTEGTYSGELHWISQRK